MLVLSRKPGERVMIGPNIVVTVLEVRGKVVKLGCEAPSTVPICRQEVSQNSAGCDAEPKRPLTESPFFVECA